MRAESIASWLATIAVAILLPWAPATMAREAEAFLPLAEEAEAPRGYVELCGARPELCRSFAGPREPSREDAPSPGGEVALWDARRHLGLTCRVDGLDQLAPLCRVEAVGARREEGADGSSLPVHLALDERLWMVPRLPLPLPLPTPVSAPVLAIAPPQAAPPDWPRLLRQVNARVNARVHQQSDLATYGVPELWRPAGDGPGAVGDCEDIALEKRVELIARDFPPDRLFLAVVYRAGVGLHTVLVARLDTGDVVLDSRVDYIEAWHRAGYSWLSVETPGQPQAWRAVA